MSELALTIVRLAFLGLLWAFVLGTVLVLRRDIRQPADSAMEASTSRTKAKRAPKAPKPPRVARKQKVRGTKLVVIDGP